MIECWNLTIPELTGNELRRAYVYLPNSLEYNPSLRFPVLYMFDGHNLFFDQDATYGKSWNLAGYLDAAQTPLIVAAVECNHSPDNGRLSEYSPFSFQMPNSSWVTGRGRITMDWMVHIFKPYIDQAFPTLPSWENTWIAGSSMGGLMSLYALLEYNWAFSRAAALSPSLWVAPDRLEGLISAAHLRPNSILYMDYGSLELGNHPNMVRHLGRIAQLLMEKEVLLNCRIVPDGDHSEASWERQIPFFIGTLFYGRL